MVQQYDFAGKVRDEVEALERELSEAGVREGVAAAAKRMNLPEQVALGALYRAAKRSGYTLKLLLDELNRQLDLEVAREAGKR